MKEQYMDTEKASAILQERDYVKRDAMIDALTEEEAKVFCKFLLEILPRRIILVNFRIELTNTQRIGFSGIPNQLVAYLFGPAVSCLFAGALDIIKYLIKPVGAFFPGLTLVTMLAGLIYGFFFYKKPLKLTRVLAAHFLVCLVCNVILNTLCLSILYGQAFMILLPPRVIQNIVKWPIDSFIFFNVAKMLEMSGVFRVVRGSRAAVQR